MQIQEFSLLRGWYLYSNYDNQVVTVPACPNFVSTIPKKLAKNQYSGSSQLDHSKGWSQRMQLGGCDD